MRKNHSQLRIGGERKLWHVLQFDWTVCTLGEFTWDQSDLIYIQIALVQKHLVGYSSIRLYEIMPGCGGGADCHCCDGCKNGTGCACPKGACKCGGCKCGCKCCDSCK
ncbi:hypothetical protein D915_001836 [Fasciola hepatica]|uniref:Metallothionein n=2 Tax=Fasciola TaxID=6191 RepID=A0A4E0S2B8_FASHE|nr:hypothetical protein D915_001836 [Fasciola hepatica]